MFHNRIFAALALLAAAPLPAQAPPIVARLGQTVRVDGPAVKPLRVIEDSRCPMNARCVWAGRVVLRALVRTGRGTRTIDLTLGEPVQVADGRLTLASVTPDREAGRRGPLRYRFGFTFMGGL